MPTLNPAFAALTAKFAVTEDFPTPPFPDAIPITRVSESGWANGMNFSLPPLIMRFTLSRCSWFITPNSITNSPVIKFFNAVSTSERILSFSGQPEIVNKIFKVIFLLSISIDSTMPRSVIGRRSSGSITLDNAAVISAFKFAFIKLENIWVNSGF